MKRLLVAIGCVSAGALAVGFWIAFEIEKLIDSHEWAD